MREIYFVFPHENTILFYAQKCSSYKNMVQTLKNQTPQQKVDSCKHQKVKNKLTHQISFVSPLF